MRAEAEIVFTWWRERDPRNYEVVEGRESGRPLLDAAPTSIDPTRIKPNRKCLDRYRPLDEFQTLWERFARIEKREDAVEFVRAYGPLSREGLRGKGDAIVDILLEAESMQSGSIGKVTLDASVADGTLRISPRSLLDAIWLQYTKIKSEGRANRCPQCRALFAKGPDTGRRADAKFCSDECRVKLNSLARSRKR